MRTSWLGFLKSLLFPSDFASLYLPGYILYEEYKGIGYGLLNLILHLWLVLRKLELLHEVVYRRSNCSRSMDMGCGAAPHLAG